MIVTCEECTTRFRLDESRIPAQGARVRCSRCKHAFFLKPPAFDDRDLLDDLAAEAAARPEAHPEPPPATEDLAPEAPPEPEPPAVDESDWEFTEDLPGEGVEPTPPPPLLPQEETPAPEPRDWDFLARDEPAAQASPQPELASAPARRSRPAPSGRNGLLTVVGWATTLALALFAFHGALLPQRRPAPVPAISLNGIRALELRTRWVENAFAGPLLVVSGALRAESEPVVPTGRIDVVLLDASGESLPAARAPFGPPVAEEELREALPESIAATIQEGARSLAQAPLTPGASLRVEAVFSEVPAGVARFALDAVPVSTESAFPRTFPSSPE